MPAADVAWMLAALALVIIMFPGIALFYGGMVGSKNALNMIMMTMSTLATVTVLYVLFGHGLVVGDSVGGWGLIGNPDGYLGFLGIYEDPGEAQLVDPYWFAFYILFAAITVAIVASGAVGRMKFGGWLVFSAVWATLVYFPLGHWVFAFDGEGTQGGWMRNDLGLHDYAGGTAVHMSAGLGALALAMVLGPRKNMGSRPHNLPLVLLGAGLLWMGWFGFNGGTAGGANFLAQYAVMTTLIAGATGMIGFCLVEKIRDGAPTTLGMASGIIAGLVGITPSADAVDALGAIVVGVASGAFVAWACTWKAKLGVDESLDAFAVHGMGGIVGSLCVVLIGYSGSPAGIKGVLFGGSWDIAWREVVAIGATCGYAFVMTWIIAKVLDKTMGLRVDEEKEFAGLDLAEHSESAYDIERSGGSLGEARADRLSGAPSAERIAALAARTEAEESRAAASDPA
ncbi:ammonium transporter [Nocardioides sp. ChNu-153]|uniref:ammonium transporter n=1 Tax=Nocardioides sp. ChNu-153 TaxID=2779364 RepID=UPI00264F5CBA|nr:ammonium transporter [Nocardioides sp. ChNu-153]MDN7122777.1 ammonium transporter [Nocardioides sp. ChNu-153]